MVDSAASEQLTVASHAGPYTVSFNSEPFAPSAGGVSAEVHFVLDGRLAELYGDELAAVLSAPSVLVIEASEASKSLERFPAYVEHLVGRGVRRGHRLIAIGGGVIQDITCFLAATMMRGLPWWFYPTTLLAQADSCIGSKSSINVGAIKNILGTFTPPAEVIICPAVLRTLSEEDTRSGVGEMLKVHAIEGPESFETIAADYERLLQDESVLTHYIHRSLEIKRRIIEVDEFDRGPRNVMNYGHSFGHAIESATNFAVPHGIAITAGMDMANYVAARIGRADERHYRRMHPVLRKNYAGFENVEVPLEPFLEALTNDKKNTSRMLRLVLPDMSGRVSLVEQRGDDEFRSICADYLFGERV
jgi:3-dehydroquinate synthase